MSIRDQFILEDPGATAVLSAYWPAHDDMPEDQRFPAAVRKRLESHPVESRETAEAEVRRLLEWDNNEQAVLLAYGDQMHRHAQFMHEAVKFVRDASPTREAAKANWVIIWRAIDEALNRAAAISRMFDATEMGKNLTPEDKDRRRYRKKLLRLALGVDSEKFVSIARDARNIIEHFEEYLDKEIHDAIDHGIGFGDMACLSTSEAAQALATSHLLRWYDYESHTIHVFDKAIQLDALDEVYRGIGSVIYTSIRLRGRYHIQWRIGVRDPLTRNPRTEGRR
jgi:hypothetical protein